jgi:penicillin-binding protein 1B
LATKLDDSPLSYRQQGSEDWTPRNYDKKYHGTVSLREALAYSYNVSTARLGLQLGISEVMTNLERLGLERSLPGYASSLLGANSLSPFEVAQIYQTIASGGFRTSLKSIREILTAEGEPLQRYPLNVEQVIDSESAYLISTAMQDVIRLGTARRLRDFLPLKLNVAGKTGTTDDFRDSWFSGITGDRLAVVWIGRDDNQSTGLTGASGAMTVWGTMMADLAPQPLVLPEPENIEQVWIDPESGLRSARGCSNAVRLPFVRGSAPTETAPCGSESMGQSIKGWLERILK